MKRPCRECDKPVRAEVLRTPLAVKAVEVILCPVCDTRTCRRCGEHVSDPRAEKCPRCGKSVRLGK